MRRIVYVNFQNGDGFEDISHLVKYDTLRVSLRAASDNYHYAQNEASFDVIYDSAYYSKFRYNENDILVRIIDVYDDAILTTELGAWLVTESGSAIARETGGTVSAFFYGRVPPTKSREYNGKLDNTIITLEALDEMMLLDVKVGDIAYKNYKIMDPSAPSTSIVHQLCYIAGLSDSQIDQTVTIGVTIPIFVPPSEETTVLALLDALLFEYGYILNMDSAGQVSPLLWMCSGGTVHEFNDNNIIKNVSITDTLKQYDGAEVVYYEIDEMASTLPLGRLPVYTDKAPPISDTAAFSGYSVLPGTTYPPKTNTTDPVTGQPYVVFQDYDDSAIRYWTNEAIVNKLDYNYKAFDSDYKDMLLTENHLLDWRGDAGLVVTTEIYYNKKARVVITNPTGSPLNLYYLRILATAYYRKAERKATVKNFAEAASLDTYTSQFISDEVYAAQLAKYLAAQQDINATTFRFESEENVSEGTYVRVYLLDGTDQNGYILQKEWDEYTQLWSYTVKANSEDIGELTEQEYRESPVSIPPVTVQSKLSNYDISVPAKVDGSSPDMTGAEAFMHIMTMGVDDSAGWGYSVVFSGLTGSLGTGVNANKLTVTGFDAPATMIGTATITASRSGYSDQVEVFTVRKAISTDAQELIQDAQDAADAAQADADTANGLLSDIASDSKFTPVEKTSVRKEWDEISSEKAGIDAQANYYSIVTEKATYNTKFVALNTYLNNGVSWSSGVPLWISDAQLGITTNIVGATFRTNFKDFYDARQALLNKIVVSAEAKAYGESVAQIPVIAPKYLGRYNAAHPVSYNPGDWWTVYDTDDAPIQRGVWYSNAGTPARITTASSAVLQAKLVEALTDVAWAEEQGTYGTSAAYGISTLFTSLGVVSAFIESLVVKKVSILAGGYLLGGSRYNESGTVIDSAAPGIYIPTAGVCKLSGVEFDGPVGSSVYITGISKSSDDASLALGYRSICAFGPGEYVLFDELDSSLRKYIYGPSGYVQEGNALTVTGAIGHTVIAALEYNKIALIDSTLGVLRKYSFDGTNWSLVGNSKTIADIYGVSAMTNSRVVVATDGTSNKTLRTFAFDGTDWNQVGSSLDTSSYNSASTCGITNLLENKIAWLGYDGDNVNLEIFEFDGSAWSHSGNSYTGLGDNTISKKPLCALNSQDFIYSDADAGRIYTYRFDGTNIIEIGRRYFVPATPARTYEGLAAVGGNEFIALGRESLSFYRVNYGLNTPYALTLTQ